MCLPEEDPIVFEHFIDWIYYPDVSLFNGSIDPPAKDLDDCILTAVHLYILAEQYDVPKLRNDICRKLCYIFRLEIGQPHTAAAELILENTSPRSLLRKMLVDWYVHFIEQTCSESRYRDDGIRGWLIGRPDFWMDVTYALAENPKQCLANHA